MIDDVLRDAKQHMESTISVVTHEFNTLRTGHASISILDDVVVDYYGAPTPLNQLASLSAPEANLLMVQPYDKSAIDAIEKAMERDTFMSPEEAQKFGLIDNVVERHELPAADEAAGESDGGKNGG